MCWGYAKHLYRLNPESSKEDVLEKNALAALEQIPLEVICQYVFDDIVAAQLMRYQICYPLSPFC